MQVMLHWVGSPQHIPFC